MQTGLLVRMVRMMLEETKNLLNEMIIELHEQARHISDETRSLEIRKVADEISDLIKKDRDVTYGL